jgi:YegS/Rv2252/BmrU family lipid kinase
MADRVWFLVNPGGGRGRTGGYLERLRARAAALGAPLRVSESVADLTRHARDAAAAGVERLVVAGGDGTVHHALQGLVHSATALAILPLGSGNDLATTLGMPRAFAVALDAALAGPRTRIDVVSAGERFFGCVAGVGFDSEVNRYANSLRRVRGKWIYPYATLRMLGGFVPPVLRAEHDDGVFEGPAMFAVLANAPMYGGGMRIAPAADLRDGLLDLVIVRRVSKLALLRVFPQVFEGAHVRHPAISVVRTRRARLTLSRPITAYGDGEPLVEVDAAGAEFAVVPRALEVVSPALGEEAL